MKISEKHVSSNFKAQQLATRRTSQACDLILTTGVATGAANLCLNLKAAPSHIRRAEHIRRWAVISRYTGAVQDGTLQAS